jgi:hypothetical protein
MSRKILDKQGSLRKLRKIYKGSVKIIREKQQ